MKIRIVYLIPFSLMLLYCNTLSGHRGVSDNIDESKERKVFVKEINPRIKNCYINDSLSIFIKSAWVEKQWAYAKNTSNTIIYNRYQLIIESDKNSINGLASRWQIGNSFVKSFRRCSKSAIMIDLDSIPNDENLIWLVTKGHRFDSTQVIGKFDLRSSK